MAKSVTAAVGVDLGYHTIKAVRLQRRGADRIALVGYAIREIGDKGLQDDELQHHLKLLTDELGGKVKSHSACMSGDDMILRIVDQQATPLAMLRNALKINAPSLLHEDCKHYLLDCDSVDGKSVDTTNAQGKLDQVKYLVGGLPRAKVAAATAAFAKLKAPLDSIQLAPVSLFNAFEYARPQIFANDPFLLLDIGHHRSTVVGGASGCIVMVRTISYGGKNLLDDIMMNGAIDREAAILLLEQGDSGLTDAVEKSLQLISREMLSSIGFYEGQLDRSVRIVHVSGAAIRAEMVLQALSDNLNFPCEAWDPLGTCEVALPDNKRRSLQKDSRCLNVAFGAAYGMIRGAHLMHGNET